MASSEALARVWLCSLRREYPLSGESDARRFFKACLQGKGEGALVLVDGDDELAASSLPEALKCMIRPVLLARQFRREKPDVLLLKIPTLGQLPLAALLTLGYRGRVLVWVEGLGWRRPPWPRFVRLLLREPLLTLGRMLLNRPALAAGSPLCEFVVSSRRQVAEIRCHRPGATVHRIPNSLGGGTPPAPLRTSHAGPLRIGYLGHGYLIKGVHELLEALAILRRCGVAATGHFALSALGAKGVAARVRAEGHELLGKVDPAVFYAGIDLLVFPYWAEWGTNVYPNVLLESLYYGVPVLTTDLPLIRECFRGPACPRGALFIPEATPEALAKAIKDIVSGRTSLPGREILQQLFREKHDAERICHQWKALLRSPRPTP